MTRKEAKELKELVEGPTTNLAPGMRATFGLIQHALMDRAELIEVVKAFLDILEAVKVEGPYCGCPVCSAVKQGRALLWKLGELKALHFSGREEVN